MKTTIHKLFNSLLLLILTTGITFAQTGGHISGMLLDEQGKPMMYASTTLLNAKDSTIVKGGVSNEAGVYTFDHVKLGKYLIKASTVGYEKLVSAPFSITEASLNVTLPELKLQPSTRNLATVSVTATKPLIERKIDRTVMNVENSVLAAGNNALEILARAPGVSLDKDDNISLKGKQGVTVMLNDKLTYLTSAQLATLLRSTDGTTIQSIEIITNPSAKYDASGNSGIINIKLKKNKQIGTNGSLTAGVGYGKTWRDNESLSLNHKEGDLNIFGTFSHSDRSRHDSIGIKRIVQDKNGNSTYFNQTSILTMPDHNNSYRIGADYNTSSKNTIGVLASGYFNTELDKNDNYTGIGSSFLHADSSLHTVSNIDQTFHNFAINFNDQLKIDTNGQQINIDLDYSKFRNNSIGSYITNFTNFVPPHSQAFLGNITPSNITIRTGKADYTYSISKSIKMEAGVKFSDVKTDNDLQQSTINGGAYNSIYHFVYDEVVDAGYFNLNKSYDKTSIQAGLRAEYTKSTATGDSSSVVKSIPRNYLNLFPSVFINHTINDKNEISFSYSRRIDRPQYDNLNPFIYHLDPYTYQKGNPYLKPQYTNNFEFAYTYNKSLTVTLGYSKTTDVITEVPGADPVTKVGYVIQENLQTQNNYNVNIYSPFTITKWWEGNVNVTGFYLGFKSNGLEGGDLNKGQAAYQIRINQTLTPIKGYKFELTGDYQSALTYGLFEVKPQYGVDAGVSHSFAKKKANIKFSVSDIFNIRKNDVTSHYQAVNFDVTQKHETRIARLTFTYNFGSNKVQVRQRRTGADDEKGRVKGAN